MNSPEWHSGKSGDIPLQPRQGLNNGYSTPAGVGNYAPCNPEWPFGAIHVGLLRSQIPSKKSTGDLNNAVIISGSNIRGNSRWAAVAVFNSTLFFTSKLRSFAAISAARRIPE